jgi:branched-chain amino acid aminotransferase
MLIYLHDKFINEKNGHVPVNNRSFRYGDGFFETVKCLNGKIPLWDFHANRILGTIAKLKFEVQPYFNTDFIHEHIGTLVERNQHKKCARVRITIYRGEGGIYDAINQRPHLLIQSWPLNPQHNLLNENGLVLGVYPDGFKAADAFANLKTNNYLLYAMAALHAKTSHWNDAVVLNHRGNIADTTIANLWIIKNGLIKTPSLAEGGVGGTMRAYLLGQLSSMGFQIEEGTVSLVELAVADEVFLTNAIYGLRWVGSFGDTTYSNRIVSEIFSKTVQPLWKATI